MLLGLAASLVATCWNSDLAIGPAYTVDCMYECGGVEGNQFATTALAVARFNLEWLTGGKGSVAGKTHEVGALPS